ncbi:MAG TPA: autotransporter domain-containing protein [Steroidobacteraceae bacterium]
MGKLVCDSSCVFGRMIRSIGCGLILLGAPLMGYGQTAGTAPSVVQLSFTPSTVASGATSRLTVVLSNTNDTATLTQALTDTLPPGLTLASGTVAGSCTTSAVSAKAGAGSFSYSAGASIPTGGCTIAVTVKGTSASGNTYFSDSIPAGALQTNLGASPTGASATLTVQAAVIVPNVVGLSQTAAATALQGAGLVLGTVTKGPASTPINTVGSQIPAPKTSVQAGSAVNIVISTGTGAQTNPNSPISTSPGINPAQVSVAAAVERTCADLSGMSPSSITTLQQHLLANCRGIISSYGGGNDQSGLKNTLDAVSGKQTTAQQQIGVKFASTQFSNIGARLAQLRQGGSSGISASGLDLGGPAGMPAAQLMAALREATGAADSSDPTGIVGGNSGDGSSTGAPSRFGFFINGHLRRGSQDTTNIETGYDFKDNGVTAGVDYRLTDSLVLGVAAGHSNGSTDFNDASAHLDSRSNTASIYGSFYKNNFYVDVIGTYGHLTYQANRTTSFALDPTVSVSAPNCAGSTCEINVNGSTGARQYALGTSAGYSFNKRGFVFGPDIALDYTRINVNGFTENDPTQSGMALAYDAQTGESLIMKAGGHLSYVLSTPIAVISPQVRVNYDHEFKNAQRASTVHFAADPTINAPNGPISNFVVFTDLPDRNYFDWAAGISAQFPFGISAFVDYSSIAGEQYLSSHEVAFGIRFQYLVR